MAKSNPDRFAEPTIIGTESEARQYANRAGATQTAPKRESRTTKKFDAEEFLRQEEENSKAEAEQLRRTEVLMNEYSLPWNIDDGKPPFPGMELNPCAVRWEPANLEEFIRKHGEEFKRFKNAKLTNQSCNQSSDQSEPQRGKASGTRKPKDMVEQEHQCTGTTVIQPKKAKSSTKTEAEERPEAMPKDAPPSDFESEHKTASEDMAIGNNSDIPIAAEQTMTVEQPKKSRVSAKKVDADFDELSHTFLRIVSLGEKKPVFLPLELRKALETLAQLSGVPNLAPSHIVINILKAFFDDNRELINRKLSGVKLSI